MLCSVLRVLPSTQGWCFGAADSKNIWTTQRAGTNARNSHGELIQHKDIEELGLQKPISLTLIELFRSSLALSSCTMTMPIQSFDISEIYMHFSKYEHYGANYMVSYAFPRKCTQLWSCLFSTNTCMVLSMHFHFSDTLSQPHKYTNVCISFHRQHQRMGNG